MNSPESAKDIPKFLELFKVQRITKPFRKSMPLIFRPKETLKAYDAEISWHPRFML